ncbi:hypothetical protein ACEN9J_02775 [Variovorax sp. Varisp41]|uniref:hypothetical protein n=1 Tax=Variovorax sp. Varisp41 TaxID=3243033 RepID=UPI0039B6CEB4
MADTTTKAYRRYKAALINLVEQDGIKEALSAVTASFVGLTTFALEQAGHKLEGQIVIDGGPTSRDITIHAPKEPTNG